jgi:putative ABC transport system ATP-binding protein
MQRVALARAVVHWPELLVADEPTGNLDSDSGGRVLEVMKDLVACDGTTAIMATHSDTAAQTATRVIQMKDGRLV